MKHLLTTLLLCIALTPCIASTNLLSNGDFEDAQTKSSFFGTNVEFTDWTFSGLGVLAIETTDVHSGKQAMRVNKPSLNSSRLSQSVDLQSDNEGQEYQLTIHYKTITANEEDIALSCKWNCVPEPSGTPHDSTVLNQVLPFSSDWKKISVTTTKPKNATSLLVSLTVKKGVIVLFDDFSLTRIEKTTPWYTVSPEKINAAQCNIGDSTLMATLTIRQGGLTEPVKLEITGIGRENFKLEKNQATAVEETIRLWFAPKTVGIHKGTLLTDCSEALDDNHSITLIGTGTDSTLLPEITLTPATLPAFSAKAGETIEDTITVTSTNCIDYIYATCTNTEENGAFRINTSMLPRNTESKVCVTFSPSKAGTYSAIIAFTTTGGETKTLTVTGTATEPDSTTIDWQTDFQWANTTPLTLLKEPFDSINHNRTLHLDGWQNIVKQGARPWWGYEDVNNNGEHCAKATAYIWGETDSTLYEMWLVTPALEYRNAANQVFTFRVRGDYIANGQNATLQLYYIDATDTTDVFYQDLEIEMPTTEDQAGDWFDFQVNLTGQTSIADTFYMAFRFTGYSGVTGAATYLIDDVSWGRDDLPLITADSTQIIATTSLNEKKTIPVKITGTNLTESISISVTGNNANKFSATPTTLLPLGGAVLVEFQSDQEGVHEAYLRIRSRGAVDLYIPMAVLVKSNTAIDNIENNANNEQNKSHLLLHNGTLYIRTSNANSVTYHTLLGQPIRP